MRYFYDHHCIFSITNLKFWGSSEQIITKTLQLLSDLSVGYSSVRKLVKLEAVQFMLNNHTVSIPSIMCCLIIPPKQQVTVFSLTVSLSIRPSVFTSCGHNSPLLFLKHFLQTYIGE